MARFKVSQVVLIAGALALLGVGGYAGYRRIVQRPAQAAAIATADAQVGTITATVSATGNVAAPTQAKLGFSSSGRLAQLLVTLGDQVTAGQPLAKLDESDLQVALQQAQASYTSAVAKLEQTKAGSRPEDIQAAQAQVDSAQAKLNQLQAVPNGPDVAAAQSQLASAQAKLDALQHPSQADLASAQAQLDAAQAKLDALQHPSAADLAPAQSQLAQAQLKLQALLNPLPEDIQAAQAAVTSAQAKLGALQHPRPEDLAAAQAQLDQAKTKLAQLQDQPKTATPQDLANAQLAVQQAQVAYDKALADAASAGKPGSSLSPAAADAAVKTALIQLQQAQNNLGKLQQQGPSDWDVRQAQEAVNAAQATLDKLQHPSPTDLQQAQAAVDQAQANLDKLLHPSDYDVQQAQEAVTQAQANLDKLLHPSPADLQQAQAAVVQAQANLAKLQQPSDYDLQQAQEAVKQAQANLDKLLAQNRVDVQQAQDALVQAQANLAKLQNGATAQDIAQAQAAVDQAQAQLVQARANLEAATLVAPFAGVVAATGANPGEQVGASTAVITLVDTSQVRVDVVVAETDVARVKAGQPVALTFDALPGKQVSGTVSVVAPVSTTTNGVVNYSVEISLDPQQAQAAGVRPGMTATASIVTESHPNVVEVPNRAIKTQGRTKTVQVLDASGKTETRTVQTGVSNDQFTEIVSGLQAGEKVVIPTTSTAPIGRVPGLGGPGGPPGIGG